MASRYANIARTASAGGSTATALDRVDMQDRGKAQGRWLGWLAASAVLLTITLIGISYRQQLQEISVADIVTYLQAHAWQVLPAFLLATVAGVVILLPGAAFILVAGAVYGMALGTVIGFTGVLAGQCAAFFLGKHMFKDTLTAWIARRFPTWGLIERALFQQGGGKLLVLLRLSPLLPDSVMNYALAVTSIKLPVYALATGIATVPYALLYAGLGSASSDIAKTMSGDGDDTNPWLKLGMIIASILLFAILLVYVGATLKKALAQAAVNERTGNVVVVGSGNGGDHTAARSGRVMGDDDEDEGEHHGGDVEAQPLLAGK